MMLDSWVGIANDVINTFYGRGNEKNPNQYALHRSEERSFEIKIYPEIAHNLQTTLLFNFRTQD